MTTVTKEELDLSIAASVQSALKAERKAEAKKAKKKAKKMPPPFMAEKNANNGGDITEQAMRGDVHGAHDANDVNSIPNGGHVDGQYVNKQGKKGKTIKGLASSVDELKTLVSKMANAPRPGGPVLDGQARGAGVSPASEARFSETVAKGLEGDPEFVRLEKALAESKDPMERDQLSRQVTLRRLTRGHEMGLI